MIKLMWRLIPKGLPYLFCICSNSKVYYLNLKADQVALVLKLEPDMPIEIEHIAQRDGGLFPESLFALAQYNYWSHDGSVEPSIFVGVIIMATLFRIRL